MPLSNEEMSELDKACQRGLEMHWWRAFRYAIIITAVPVFAACWWLTNNVAKQAAEAETRKAIAEQKGIADALVAVLNSQVKSATQAQEDAAKFSREKTIEVATDMTKALNEVDKLNEEIARLRKTVENARDPLTKFAAELKDKSPTVVDLFAKLAALEKRIDDIHPAISLELIADNSDSSGGGSKQFSLKKLLEKSQDGTFYVTGTIATGDVSNGIDNRFQFAQYIVKRSASGNQIDVAQIAERKQSGNANGFKLDNTQGIGLITAEWGGSRPVQLLIWRCINP